MNYWASGGPVSQQLCSEAPGCWYFPAGSCMTNGRLCHLLFSVPNDRASSSIKGWKPLVILTGRGGKGCWQTFLANEGLCPTSCNLVIPQAAQSYTTTTTTPQVPPTPNLPPFSGFKVGYRAVNRWYFSWLERGQIPMVTPEQQLALSYTALSGNKLPLFCIHPLDQIS